MNKKELVNAIADKAGFTAKDTEVFVNAYIDVITEALKAGDKVSLVGFGNFELKAKEAREGFNPATGEKILIPATNVPVFKAGKAYKELFN